MYLSTLIIESFRCFGSGANHLEVRFTPGLTALVGENDSGKTAIIDALRFVLRTTDQEWLQLEDADFHEHKGTRSTEIRIACKFEGLTARDKRAFVEYLTYGEKEKDEPVFYVNWTAKHTGKVRRGRPYLRPEVHSGKDGNGPPIATEARDLLRVTYLRPLRDAEQVLSAGRGSRLAQILQCSDWIKRSTGTHDRTRPVIGQDLSVLTIANLIDELLKGQSEIKKTRDEINDHLKRLSLSSEDIKGTIKVSSSTTSDDIRLRQLLEKLDLILAGEGKLGLGSNNLLFMACELLLLVQEDEGNKLLLIEEPEAHLHPQRQLRVIKALQDQAEEKSIQIIVTTHSPNLASVIKLNNIVMIHNGRAFSMAEGQTQLDKSDYRFLQRFLDVTKANLFFAHGVMIVEGDAENILLPTLGSILGCDFAEYGVSIVNVGGVGLRRYAKVFLRKNVEEDRILDIPVACVTDMDVMPNCAPVIIGKIKETEEWPAPDNRRWRAKQDIADIEAHRKEKAAKALDQNVTTFVSDEWTLEYDLALGPKAKDGSFRGDLAEDVFVAACLAKADEAINSKKTTVEKATEMAVSEFSSLKETAVPKDCCSAEEVLASSIYAKFAKGGVSKPIAAQYLAGLLRCKYTKGKLTSRQLRARLPKYLTEAIDYVTGGSEQDAANRDEAQPNE